MSKNQEEDKILDSGQIPESLSSVSVLSETTEIAKDISIKKLAGEEKQEGDIFFHQEYNKIVDVVNYNADTVKEAYNKVYPFTTDVKVEPTTWNDKNYVYNTKILSDGSKSFICAYPISALNPFTAEISWKHNKKITEQFFVSEYNSPITEKDKIGIDVTSITKVITNSTQVFNIASMPFETPGSVAPVLESKIISITLSFAYVTFVNEIKKPKDILISEISKEQIFPLTMREKESFYEKDDIYENKSGYLRIYSLMPLKIYINDVLCVHDMQTKGKLFGVEMNVYDFASRKFVSDTIKINAII